MSEIAGRQPSGELRGGVLSSDFSLWRPMEEQVVYSHPCQMLPRETPPPF